jgi:hypothetical protein
MNGSIGGAGPWADAMLTDATHISAVAISAPRETRAKQFVRPRLMSQLFSYPGAVVSGIEFPRLWTRFTIGATSVL